MSDHIICLDLHGGHCPEPLRHDYRFCPLCGRLAAALTIPNSSGGVVFSLREGSAPARRQIKLHNPGLATLNFQARISDGAGLKLVSRNDSIPPKGNLVLPIEIETDEGTAWLTFSTRAAARDENSWVMPEMSDHLRLAVRWGYLRPGKLEILTPVLRFHERGAKTAVLRIRNAGDESLTLNWPLLPEPFHYPHMEEAPLTLAGGEECRMLVQHVGARLLAQTVAVSFRGASEEVRFECRVEAEAGGRSLPDWIVGIDFGTSNTSVVVRRVSGHNPGVFDRGDILTAPGDKGRFSSAIFYEEQSASWFFGKEAIERNLQGDCSGFLIDDGRSLKMSLSAPDETYLTDLELAIPPHLHRDFMRASLLRRYFRYLRDTILGPFLALYPQSPVQYVLSLPVLDGHDGLRYRRQKATMVEAFAEVFDVSSDAIMTELEPNCAAFHFLVGQGAMGGEETPGRRSRFLPGERFLVVDSGGGTTDIAYGEFGEYEAGVLKFAILGNVGEIKGEAEREEQFFGGRSLNRYLHRELNQPGSFEAHEPCPVTGLETGQTSGPTCSGVTERIERDYKRALAKGGEGPSGLSDALKGHMAEGLTAYVQHKMVQMLTALSHVCPEAFQGKTAPSLVFLVGGNTLVRSLQVLCSKSLADDKESIMPHLPDDERLNAVALGSVYAGGLFARPLSPCDFVLKVTTEGGTSEIWKLLARNQCFDDYDLPPRRFEGSVLLTLTAEDGVLLRQSLGRPGQTTQIAVALRRGDLRLATRTAFAFAAPGSDEEMAPGLERVLFDSPL